MKKQHKFLSPYFIPALLLLFFAGCNHDCSDAVEQLFETVPATAQGVATINIQNVQESGKSISNDSAQKNHLLFQLFSPDSGVEPSALVAFIDGNSEVVTGFLEDSNKFKGMVADAGNGKFRSDNDLETCGNVIIKGNQFWIFNSKASAEKVKQWSKLTKVQSFAARKNLENLIACQHPVTAQFTLEGLLSKSTGNDFRKTATYQLLLGTLFNDLQTIEATADLKKNIIDCKIRLLNSKGTPAQINLPFKKIDTNLITNMGGSAPMFGAINISEELVEKLEDAVKNFGGTAATPVAFFSALDGTCAFKSDGSKFDFRIQLGSGNPDMLIEALQTYGKHSISDHILTVNSPESFSGGISAAEAAKELKGSWFGVVASGKNMNDFNDIIKKCPENINTVSIAGLPDGSGLQLNLKLRTSDN